MNDTYYEKIVKRKTSSVALLLRFIVVFITVIVMYLGTLALGLSGIIGGILFIWIDTVIFKNTDVEYEYLLIGGELSVDAIYGKKKRKKCRRLDMRKIEVFAPINSDKIKECKGNRKITVADYSSGTPEGTKYAFVIPEEEGRIYEIIFEPSEEMVNSIKFVAPGKVFMY